MTGKDAIKTALSSTQNMVGMYVADLSDADLLIRPVPGSNHIAWQLGHLITSEVHMLAKEMPGMTYPELPAGFADKHKPTTASVDGAANFGKKEEYLALFNKVRGATLENLSRLSDADLDKPTSGNMAKFAPTFGSLLMLTSNHTLMHAGQFSVVRRKLGKPILF
jgi:hypothetical protein